MTEKTTPYCTRYTAYKLFLRKKKRTKTHTHKQFNIMNSNSLLTKPKLRRFAHTRSVYELARIHVIFGEYYLKKNPTQKIIIIVIITIIIITRLEKITSLHRHDKI